MLKFRASAAPKSSLAIESPLPEYNEFKVDLLARKQYLADPVLLSKIGLDLSLNVDPIRPRSQFMNERNQRRPPCIYIPASNSTQNVHLTDASAPVSTATVGPVALDYATTADTDTPTPPPQPRQHHPAAMDAATVAHEDDATTLIAGNQPAAACSAAVDDCSNELMCEAASLADSAIVTVGPTSVDGAAAAAVARDAHNTSDTAEMPTPETAARVSTTAPPPPKPVTITIAHSFTYESSAGQPVEIRALAEDVVESSTATTTVASGGNQVGNTNDLDAGEHAAEVENVLSRSPMRRTFEQAYRVESPKPAAAVAAAAKRVALGEIKKSRSMDDNEMLIQEMSDTGSTSGENENTPIVSEAESEVETTTASGGAGQPDQTQTIQLNGEDVVVLDDRLFVPIKVTQETNVECIRYADPPVVDLSEEEEALIRELMNGAASVQDAQAQRARKKAAIESHFYPQFINPKYLDVIKEESDAGSSTDRSGNVSPSRTKMYEDLEDDVFLDNAEISAKANTVFPKSSFDFSSRRKHVSRLRGPKGSVIREEPQCVLVGAKIVDPEQNREGCGAWTTSVIDGEKEHSAELVYLAGGSSSSSASDMCDLDSTSAGDEADAEDQDGVDSDDVRINTPTIGGDGNQRLFALWSDPEPTTPATNTTRPDPTPIVPPAEPSPSAHVPEFRIGAPCSANMFPILSPADILAKHNIITRITHDFTRQDSSGSLCSTVSHSTTHSQCTARFCSNPSPPRDLLDFEGSAPCVSGPNSLVRTDPRQMETLRQLCLDRLSNMPYGYLILKELATVAGSLGELVGRHNTQLHEQRLREQEPVRQPSKSPSPPPVPQLPKVQSWLGFPAQDQPAVASAPTTTTHPTLTHQATSHPVHTHVTERLVGQVLTTICEHQQRTDESTDDVSTGAVDNNRLLAIIRGAGDQSEPAAATNGSIPTAAPSQPKPHSEPQREIPKMTAESDVTGGAKVHVIRVETGGDIPRRTADAITTNGAKNPTGLWDSSSVSSTSSSKHFSSTSSSSSCSSSSTLKSSITSGAQPADTKHYSSQESSSTQAERRIENGNVVFDFVDSTSQRSSTGNKDDVNCIAANVPKHPTVEVKTTATSTDDTAMKSDIKLDRNETRASSHAASAAPPTIQSVHSHEHPPQPAARNSTDARIDGGNVRAAATTTKHVEYFDHDRLRFSDFNAFANEFFMEHPSPASTESPRAPTTAEPSPATPSDSIDIPVEHIVKPIAIEEDLCKGRLIHHQIRAPRISDTQPSLATSFDETKRQYDIATHLNNHNQRTSSRLSMIDETPITTHVSPHPTHHPVPPRRRLSLPKELHDKQMDYIRQKEVELHLEYDKLEQERRTLMRDIEQMKVNQAFQDFVTAHKNQVRQSTTQAFTNFASEAELLRQKMHDEWLGKVAEREERRLHKIIKITKPNETELFAPPPPIPEATKPLPVGLHPPNLGNEFLSKVKERRTKLKMPSDSDWESGAESQPEPRKSTESKLDPSIKVLEGSTETDVTKLPSHLREFACEFTKKEESFSNYQSSSEHSVERVRRNGTEDGIWSPSTTPTLPRKNPQPPTTSTPIVTTPGTPATATPIRSPSKTSLPSPTPPTPPPPPPFWAPSPSPTLERKEFRPIKFESPVAARKIFTKDTNQPPTSPPWTNQQQAPERLSTVLTAPFQGGANSASGVRQIPITLQHTPHKVSFVEPPQVTQKHHEQLLTTHQSGGQRIVQEEQSYSSSSTSSRCVSGSSSQQQQQSGVTQQQQLHRQPPPPPLPQPPKQPQQQQPISSTHSGTATRSNEVIHPIRVEGVVEHQHSEAERSSNIAMKHQQQQQQLQTQTQRQETAQTVPARPKCADIGPTTRDGMPIVLRSEVEEDLHHKWYKRMYNTLHKVHQDDDSVTVRYKTRRGRYPYKSNGYISEPEPSYDSDYSSTKYSTLDRRRSPVAAPVIEPVPRYQPQAPLLRHYADDNLYGTLPAKSTPSAYKLNPGRIENFTPGHVAASDKDRKDRLEYERPVQRAYYEGNLSKALKDQGYESDSTLVFRKKEQAQLSHLNHDQQKQAYLQLQAGGEVPIHGFRKPAPEKPKELAELEYYPITQTLTKIRLNPGHAIPQPQREILCYPIANVSRPIDMFGAFPKSNTHFVPVSPPPPPCRMSSKRSTTLRIFSDIHALAKTEAAQKPASPRRPGSTEPSRSKSTGSMFTTFSQHSSQKEEKNFTNHSRLVRRNFYRVASVSPVGRRPTESRKSSASPIAFGRSISKERTFAEEKKRLEERNPLCRRSFTASTSILRNPELKSPDEVKRAIKTTFQMPARNDKMSVSRTSRNVATNGVVKSSSMNYTLNKFERGPNKSVSVTMSSRANQSSPATGRTTSKPLKSARVVTPVVRSSRSTESKYLMKSKQNKLNGSTSNLSLARTSSTYSIDSVSSTSKRTPRERPQIITRSTSSDKSVIILNGKARKKKSTSREKLSSISSGKDKTVMASKTSKHDKTANQQLHDAINEEIMNHHSQSGGTHFFQNLFQVPSPVPEHQLSSLTSVQQKAQIWNSIVASEQAECQREMDRERARQSRSLSPRRVFQSSHCGSVFGGVNHHVSKFDSLIQLSEEEDQFGPKDYVQISHKYEERSRSAPGRKMFFTEVVMPNEPIVIHGRTERSNSPQRDIRSPSCRRIQSYRSNNKQSQINRVARARSLGSTSDRYHSLDTSTILTSRSSCALNSNTYENHSPHCVHQNSDRFNDLNKFYSNLERVAQLEKATSSTDIRPIRKQGEVIDFDLWKRIRTREKAEKELNVLVDKIKKDEKDKDLLFRARYPEDHKWSMCNDSGLRIKEKSVEDLKEILQEKCLKTGEDNVAQQLVEIDKGKYKSLWRGSSVLDLASSMVDKYNADDKAASVPSKKSQERRLGISKKLISTLSEDQISTIKHQLSEIYTSQDSTKASSSNEQYFVEVSGGKKSPSHGLTVRSNSMLLKEELLGPVLKRHQARVLENCKSESTGMLHQPRVSQSISQFEDTMKKDQSGLSETEKRSILHLLSKEVQEKVNERRDHSIVLAKETRGATASDSARNTMTKTAKPCPEVVKVTAKSTTKAVIHTNPFLDETVATGFDPPTKFLPLDKKINDTIEYFEKKQVEPPPEPTVYRAREYSSPDEEEIMRMINKNMKERSAAEKRREQTRYSASPQGMSSSVSDFKELFGETSRNISRSPSPAQPPPVTRSFVVSPVKVFSNSTSIESVFRSRSISPLYDNRSKNRFHSVHTGEVRKIKDRFESLNLSSPSDTASRPVRRFKSDPEINKITASKRRPHESGDVSWITHKFETTNSIARSRSRTRKSVSPIPRVNFKRSDRFMPHIDIISKTAALKQEMRKSADRQPKIPSVIRRGDVKKIRNQFEAASLSPPPAERDMSMLGQMYTSSPDISELKDISTYLTGDWVAHKYPKTRDNARSPVCPEKGPISGVVRKRTTAGSRPCSASPPRVSNRISPQIKPFYRVFEDDDDDVAAKKPSWGTAMQDVEQLWRKLQKRGLSPRKHTVKFQDSEVVPPPPPVKGASAMHASMTSSTNGIANGSHTIDVQLETESPRRYVESDVNIHYKTPVRYEYKDPVPELELAYRQSEHMKHLYADERHRKYLQELQDISNRRHADYFSPNQKSPIALNRYDDFGADAAAPVTPPRIIARALYNFQGLTARELSFKKGDIIYIRREVDKNWYEGEHNATVGLLPSNYVEIISKDGARTAAPKKPTEGQARAKFNFHAQSAIELSLNKGELVSLTRRVDDNWFEGRIANRKGIFPVSYVDILTDIGSTESQYISVTSKLVGSPSTVAGHSLTVVPTHEYSTSRTNLTAELHQSNNNNNSQHINANLVAPSNGHANGAYISGSHVSPSGTVRETKTIQKTEVLHVDTHSEPIAYRAIYMYRPQNTDELELHEGDTVYVLEKCDDGWFVGTSQRTGCFGTFPGNYVEKI